MHYLVSLLNSPLQSLTYTYDEELKSGNIVEVTLNSKSKLGVVISKTEKPEFTCTDILSVKDGYFDKVTLSIAKFISEYYVCSLGDALNLFVFFPKNSLHINQHINTDIKLSPEQQKAYEFIQRHDRSLLFGDTGSGKTEVYIKCIEHTINSGQKAIFLMPEIGLTPQTKKRLKNVFGDMVAIWHSKITKKKKEKILKDLAIGKISVIAGTRSALFLPVHNLGLIVVDEEHDDSYKSSQRPRYNARDLALLFGTRKEAKVILGSATPSLSSFKNLPKHRLRGTYFDSNKKYFYESCGSELSQNILNKIHEHLEKQNQIIVFLPTRANFKYITCRDCGANVTCPYCSVGMSLHVDKNALKCHYCNFAMRIPKECPSCKSEAMHSNRIGTAEVVKRLQEEFSDKVIKKFDRDEVSTANKLKATLNAFNEKEIDILVGTQMLSKGHDYHSVGLSVIIGIDSILNMPDFRAREKAMSLLLQVAGRSGRKGEGEVFIQTQNREFFEEFIEDYEAFLNDELQYRQEIYPPYKKLLKVLVSHIKDEKANDVINQIEKITHDFPLVEVVGYGKANIEKIAGKYRYNMLLRSSNTKELLKFAHTCKQYPVEIDIDPLSFS
ncbi:primosomal protein N' [Sulfurospirillum arcachonense]|uniref:primosomal protein N' n=1 Tax=Sulfurospirillum arcachonense TaxID=57666 RepID=UPI0004689DFF|nr:primosomal protein N' [Sulfurospirillum arcachonense]